MTWKVGTLSGYHEKREHGWPRKSRIWNGDAWVTEEEFKNDKRINLKTGDLYRGTRFVESAKGVLDKTRETLTGVYDTVGSILPENNIASVTFDEAENLSKGLLSTAASTAVSAYGTLPEGIRENVQAGGSALAQTLDDSRTGWSQQLDLHPVLTDVAFGVGEAVLTTGAGPTAKFLGKTPELVNAARMTQSNRLLLNTVDINQGLLGGAVRRNAPSLAEMSAQPLQSIAGVQPSHWHRRYRKATTAKEKLDILNTPLSRSLKNKSVKGGKITANKLLKNEELVNKLVERADGIIEKYIKGDQRKLYDYASHNILTDQKPVYGTGLVQKIQQVFLVTQGKEWHHIFGNKEAGEFILNKIAQDPVLTANLFKHLDNLTIKSGAVAENMALMKLKPHKLWHEFMQQLGTESRVKMLGTDTLENLDARGLLAQNKKRQPFSRVPVKDRKIRMGTVDDVRTGTVIEEQPWKYTAPLDVADYGHEIADAISKGKADVDELFTFLTVYHDRYLPWVRQKLKDPKFASTFLSDLPDGPEKALLTGLYKTEPGPGKASLGTRGMKKR